MAPRHSKCLQETENTVAGFKGERTTGIVQAKRRCDAMRELQRSQTTVDCTEGV